MACCDLNSGKLRHRITFERATKTDDGGGGSSMVWATVATVRAYVKPISGGERLQAMRVESNITQRIYIRYRDDLAESDRIRYGSRLMQVKAIVNIEEQNKWLEVYAVEGQAT